MVQNTQISIARDIGLAKFESEGFLGAPELFSGDTPLPVSSYHVAVAANSAIKGYSVVGFQGNVPGNPIVLANWMGSLLSGDGSGLVASGALTGSAAGTAGNTITINGRVYTLRAAVAAADDIKIGATSTDTAKNITDAINADPDAIAAGTVGPGTTPHADVSASYAANVVTVRSNDPGAGGNAITTTSTGAVWVWGGATLAGGTDEGGGGVRPIGITTVDANIGAGINNATVALFTSGCFNPDALVWDDTFNTDEKKQHAFVGSPFGVIVIVKPKYQPQEAVL